jgi:hypothetical protein
MPRDPTVADCPRALVETTGSNLGLAKVQYSAKGNDVAAAQGRAWSGRATTVLKDAEKSQRSSKVHFHTPLQVERQRF